MSEWRSRSKAVQAVVSAWRQSDYDDLIPLEYLAPVAAVAVDALVRAGLMAKFSHDWYPDHDGLCVTCHLPDGQCVASPAARRTR